METDPQTGLQRFVARTALGPVGFDDPMLVTYARAPTATEPGVARIVKEGRLVLGWAVLTVTATESGSEVRWHEEAHLRGAPAPVSALVNLVVKGGFNRLVKGLLAETG